MLVTVFDTKLIRKRARTKIPGINAGCFVTNKNLMPYYNYIVRYLMYNINFLLFS